MEGAVLAAELVGAAQLLTDAEVGESAVAVDAHHVGVVQNKLDASLAQRFQRRVRCGVAVEKLDVLWPLQPPLRATSRRRRLPETLARGDVETRVGKKLLVGGGSVDSSGGGATHGLALQCRRAGRVSTACRWLLLLLLLLLRHRLRHSGAVCIGEHRQHRRRVCRGRQ